MAAVQVILPPGNLTKFATIELLANEELVTNTSFAPWAPVAAAAGAQARVSLSFFQFARLFLSRCDISPAAADVAAAAAVPVWRVRLSAAAWSRILTELKASGYAAQPLSSLRESDRQLLSIIPTTPANLLLVAADWLPAEAFTIPAGNGAAIVCT